MRNLLASLNFFLKGTSDERCKKEVHCGGYPPPPGITHTLGCEFSHRENIVLLLFCRVPQIGNVHALATLILHSVQLANFCVYGSTHIYNMLISESCFVLLYRNKGRMDKKLCKIFAQVTCLHAGIIILLLLACWGVMSTNDQHELCIRLLPVVFVGARLEVIPPPQRGL